MYWKRKHPCEIHKSLFISNFLGTVNKAFEGEDDSIKDHHASFSELPDSLKFTQDPIVQNAINRKLNTRKPKPAVTDDNTKCGSDSVASTPNGDQCKDSENLIADVKLWWAESWCLNDILSRATSNKRLWFIRWLQWWFRAPKFDTYRVASPQSYNRRSNSKFDTLFGIPSSVTAWVSSQILSQKSGFHGFDDEI